MSWKQYGGIRKNDKLNNLAIGTLVADDIILRQVKVTTHIFDDTIVARKDIQIHRNLDVSNNVDVSGALVVHKNIYTPNYVIGTNTDISLNFEEDGGYRAYISADINKQYIGIGTNAPNAFFDISSTVVDSFAIRNNLPHIRNIIAQNGNNSGVAVDTSDNIASIGFFYKDISNSSSMPRSKIISDTSNGTFSLDSSTNIINSHVATYITSQHATTITTLSGDISLNSESIYLTSVSGDIVLASENSTVITSISGDIDISANEGDVTIQSFDSTKLRSAVAISQREVTSKLKNEPFTIYDNRVSEPFLYEYYNDTELKTGTAAVSVAIDNSSTTFTHLLTPNVKGLSIGGGAYVKDSSRSMGMIGLSTTDVSFIPSQTYVSNTDAVVYRTTTGINTYAPRLNNYVMDINGPTRIGNGELHSVIKHTSKLTDIRSSRDNLNYVFTTGRRDEKSEDNTNPAETIGYASTDSGKTWTKVVIENTDALRTNNIDIFAIGDKAYTLSSNARIHRYDFASNTIDLSNVKINDLLTTSIYVKNFDNENSDIGMLISSANQIYYAAVDEDFINITDDTINYISNNISDVVASDGYGDKVYFVGNGIQTVKYSTITPELESNISTGTYKTVSAYSDTNAVAGGVNIISYTTDGGNTWNVVSNIVVDSLVITEYDITRIHMLMDGNGLAIGTYNDNTSGMILYTQNGGSIWKSVPNEKAFYSFGNEDILRLPSINGMCISNNGSFVFTNTLEDVSGDETDSTYNSGSSVVYYGIYPALFDVYNNKVLDVNGGMNVNGQILQF
tara:strand:+ start:2489 stop:4864 length:2376 start_codon:yes stop_codon:yes gene_type:complete